MKNLKIAAMLLTLLGTAFVTSCATTKGFGQDLQKVGNRLENRAESTGGTEPVRTTGITTPQPAPAPAVPSAY